MERLGRSLNATDLLPHIHMTNKKQTGEDYTTREIEQENLRLEVSDNISNVLALDRQELIIKNLRRCLNE